MKKNHKITCRLISKNSPFQLMKTMFLRPIILLLLLSSLNSVKAAAATCDNKVVDHDEITSVSENKAYLCEVLTSLSLSPLLRTLYRKSAFLWLSASSQLASSSPSSAAVHPTVAVPIRSRAACFSGRTSTVWNLISQSLIRMATSSKTSFPAWWPTTEVNHHRWR